MGTKIPYQHRLKMQADEENDNIIIKVKDLHNKNAN